MSAECRSHNASSPRDDASSVIAPGETSGHTVDLRPLPGRRDVQSARFRCPIAYHQDPVSVVWNWLGRAVFSVTHLANRFTELRSMFLASVVLLTAAVDARAFQTPDSRTWTQSDGCYIATDARHQSKLRALGMLALRSSDRKKGCVTFPYLGAPYDADGSLNPKGPTILNDVHAGIDLRAQTGDTIYAIDGGTVVRADLCLTDRAAQPQRSQANCASQDGKEHSTLIIENNAKTLKMLYLHLSEFSSKIASGAQVNKGDVVGRAGAIGTDHAHLHLEVWAASAPWYCARNRAVSGSACPGKLSRILFDKSTTTAYCELEDIQKGTVDAADALKWLAMTASMVTTRLTTDSVLTLRGFGPVRVGMTVAEAERTIGGPLDNPNGNDLTGCAYVTPRYGPGGVAFMATDGIVTRVDVNSCQVNAPWC